MSRSKMIQDRYRVGRAEHLDTNDPWFKTMAEVKEHLGAHCRSGHVYAIWDFNVFGCLGAEIVHFYRNGKLYRAA